MTYFSRNSVFSKRTLMANNNLSYYNYFLILSMVLIGGYFVASLFFINKTSNSDEKAESYRQIIEQTDNLLKHAYLMQSHVNGFLLNDQSDSYIRYKSSQCDMKMALQALVTNPTLMDKASLHFEQLENLVEERLSLIDTLLKKNDLAPIRRNRLMEKGTVLMDDIVDVLYEVRTLSTDARKENKATAIKAGKNAVFIFSFFGIVMMIIVIISFDRMRKEIKKNEENAKQIFEINKELTEVNENLASFAYIASHDLNEPLRKVRIFGDFLIEEINKEKVDAEQLKDTVGRMQKATTRMQELIDDLLMYSRVTNSSATIEKVVVKEVVWNVLNDLNHLIEEAQADIDVQSLPVELEVDKTHLRQLFQNLLSNAIKFRKPEEPLEISITSKKVRGEDVTYSVNLAPNHDFWQIAIADNGIGMEEKYFERIFAVFQRLHGKNEYKGTGIGLSICKKIVSKYKGDITVLSKEGIGSTFVIFIPVIGKQKV